MIKEANVEVIEDVFSSHAWGRICMEEIKAKEEYALLRLFIIGWRACEEYHHHLSLDPKEKR